MRLDLLKYFTLVDPLSSKLFILSKIFHNKTQKSFSTRSKNDRIIKKTMMIYLRAYFLHI